MSKSTVEPFALVIFGAGGDLSTGKLMPAMLELDRQGWLPDDCRIIATTRRDLSTEDFAIQVLSGIGDDKDRAKFAPRVAYLTGCDPAKDASALKKLLATLPYQRRVYYAATPPQQFAGIAASLAGAELIADDSPLVLEKPLGTDLSSYRAINEAVATHIPEHLIYRIDHYLGKETVQNLLCIRFGNLIFESVWNRAYIDQVQITVAEAVGVANRAGYYDASGAIRDMVQNHLAQLLCLTAMEPPRSYDADSVRDEKLKVLQSLRPLEPADVVRGQYQAGLVGGEKVASYREDVGDPSSERESFVALKAQIENWRWAGVPFYLRTGKRMPAKSSYIIVAFKKTPHMIFPGADPANNHIVIRLQPNEGIELLVNNKLPGPGPIRLDPKILNLDLLPDGGKLPDAYERLLLDALRLNPTLYMRHDEVEQSWQWLEGVLPDPPAPEIYAAGTWGPDQAQLLLAKDGRRWDNHS